MAHAGEGRNARELGGTSNPCLINRCKIEQRAHRSWDVYGFFPFFGTSFIYRRKESRGCPEQELADTWNIQRLQ
jgi:hypothetical protein